MLEMTPDITVLQVKYILESRGCGIKVTGVNMMYGRTLPDAESSETGRVSRSCSCEGYEWLRSVSGEPRALSASSRRRSPTETFFSLLP